MLANIMSLFKKNKGEKQIKSPENKKNIKKNVKSSQRKQNLPIKQKNKKKSKINQIKENTLTGSSFPKYSKIISMDGEELQLSPQLQKDYMILLGTKNDAIIICSLESTVGKSVDINILSLKKQCTTKGYSVSIKYAEREEMLLFLGKSNNDKNNIKIESEGFILKFDELIDSAIQQNVSDIHIEVRKGVANVRFRKNGELFRHASWRESYARDLSTVIYQVLGQEKETSFVETKPQAARIERIINGKEVGIRLNTMPVVSGFDVVMRVLKQDSESETTVTIADLGYSKEQLKLIKIAMKKPTGVIIIAGVTGSGKSTSLSTLLNEKIKANWINDVDGPKIKVITVEDPTEYRIFGASQHGVVRSQGSKENPFIVAISAAMRCDPDVIMVGEVRDMHSAQLLVGAVQSGHSAFTTIHAPSAVSIISRLKSFGVSNEVLGSSDFISALIYQTLIPTLCPKCSITLKQFEEKAINDNNEDNLDLIKRLKIAAKGKDLSKVRFRSIVPCKDSDTCRHGVIGRSVVAEVILPNPMVLSAFENNATNLAKYYHLKMGGKFILDHAIEKILSGTSDPEDAEESVGLLDAEINLKMLGQSLGIKDEITEPKNNSMSQNIEMANSEIFKSKLLSGQKQKESNNENENSEVIDFKKNDKKNNNNK